MGKVLKTVAIVAIAATITFYAPTLGASFLTAIGTTTATALATLAATTAVATALSIAAAAALSLLAPRPHTGTAPGGQRSRGQPMTQVGLSREYPPSPAGASMAPVSEAWWRNGWFYPWQRFAIAQVRGDCMVPTMPPATRWVVLDRYGLIERGDILLIKPDDLAQYMRASGGDPRAGGLVKRFFGVDPVARIAVYETTNPPNRIETGLDRIVHAYRVESWHVRWIDAFRALRKARAPG